MSPVIKGLIFAAIGVVTNTVLGLAVLRPLLDLEWGAAGGLTAAFALFAGLFGFFTGWKQVYTLEPRPVWVFMLDISWSSLNTVTGLVWMIWCAAKGTWVQPEPKTQKRGIMRFSGAALPGAGASTLGNVIGGIWLLHEAVHVQQARIFGPFYWPTYLLSYAANMLVRFLTGRFGDPHWEAYGRVVMEDWAERAAPEPENPGDPEPTSVKPLQTFIWLMVSLVNAAAVAVLVAPIPGVGALPDALGFDFLPWWMGLIVIIFYALGRSFMPKGNAKAAKLVFT